MILRTLYHRNPFIFPYAPNDLVEMGKNIFVIVVPIFLVAFLIFGIKIGYFKTASLLLGGQEIDTSQFPNRWERGKLLDPVIPENPFITSYHIANNGTHTFESYHVKLPPFGRYQTKWHQVPNENWEEFEEWLNTPIFQRDNEFKNI